MGYQSALVKWSGDTLVMSAGFGFSIGDLVLGLKLIKQSIEALEDTKGSSANYQALHHEIHSLQDGLEAVQELRLEKRLGPKSKSGIAIQDAVVRCQRCINVFLSTISKYQPWLKTNNASISAWKANLRKIQWALCKKEDVIRFRAQLERHSSSISMLLVTLQVYAKVLLINLRLLSYHTEANLSSNLLDLKFKTASR